MKKACGAVLSMVIFQCAFCQINVRSDLSLHALKGRVKTVRSTCYIPQSKAERGPEMVLYYSLVTRFNKAGMITEEKQQTEDGGLRYQLLCRYAADGKKEKEIYYGRDGILGFRKTYTYRGNEMEMRQFDPDGSLNAWSVSRYDEKGNEIEQTVYTREDSVYLRYAKKYDQGNNMTEYVDYRAYGIPKLHVQVKYNDQGNRVEYHSFDDYPASKASRSRSDIRYANFENGNASEVYHYNADGTLKKKLVIRFNYDAEGNYIRARTFQDGKLIINEVRDIKYYK